MNKLNTRMVVVSILVAGSLFTVGCSDDPAPPAVYGGGMIDSGILDGGSNDAGPLDGGPIVDDAGPMADAGVDAAPALMVTPTDPMATGCSVDTVMFTASGGTPPYTWSTSEGGTTNLTVTPPDAAAWSDSSDNFCGSGGSVTITVTDSVGAMATATITVLPG